jgi:hypothetical protein
MAIKFINFFQSKTLQNLPKLGFLVWKQTIWQPCVLRTVFKCNPKCDFHILWTFFIPFHFGVSLVHSFSFFSNPKCIFCGFDNLAGSRLSLKFGALKQKIEIRLSRKGSVRQSRIWEKNGRLVYFYKHIYCLKWSFRFQRYLTVFKCWKKLNWLTIRSVRSPWQSRRPETVFIGNISLGYWIYRSHPSHTRQVEHTFILQQLQSCKHT